MSSICHSSRAVLMDLIDVPAQTHLQPKYQRNRWGSPRLAVFGIMDETLPIAVEAELVFCKSGWR